MRLDVFLKRVGLVKQRTLAKQICDKGGASVDGRTAKAGKTVAPGQIISVDLRDEFLEIEVLDLPSRAYKRNAGETFYKIVKHERTGPLF